MSYLTVSQAFISALETAAILPNDQIITDNIDKDIEGKDSFISCYYTPVIEETTGKTSASSDEQMGFYQFSVFVRKFAVDGHNTQLALIDSIKAAFQPNTFLVYNSQEVHITGLSVNSGAENDAWFKRDITINYSAFTVRV